jgi:hypothetical protein
MKLTRVGVPEANRPALTDDNGKFRDPSGAVAAHTNSSTAANGSRARALQRLVEEPG